jgi:hypothetical protein
MDDGRLLDELLRAARTLGVEVRIERFETPAAGGGASCVLRGAHLILIDAGAPVVDRAKALARALSSFETDAIFMVPEARQAVDAAREPGPGGRRAQ